jgi:hypothetical protein
VFSAAVHQLTVAFDRSICECTVNQSEEDCPLPSDTVHSVSVVRHKITVHRGHCSIDLRSICECTVEITRRISTRSLERCVKVHESRGREAKASSAPVPMVVHVIYTRRDQSGRGRSLVRLAGTASGGRSLRATSPPPVHASAACWDWEPSSLRRRGNEDREEVVAAGPGAAAAPNPREEATDEYKAAFGAPPTDDEVRAAVASINQ